jgi:hypothetical protein
LLRAWAALRSVAFTGSKIVGRHVFPQPAVPFRGIVVAGRIALIGRLDWEIGSEDPVCRRPFGAAAVHEPISRL